MDHEAYKNSKRKQAYPQNKERGVAKHWPQNGWITQEASKPKKAKRGRCVFPSDNPKVTDNKDHYPYNSLSQARNALSRMMQHDGCPKWYKGTLDELRGAIKRSVYKAYPGLKNRKKERDGK